MFQCQFWICNIIGQEFHAAGPETRKLLGPKQRVLVRGVVRCPRATERRWALAPISRWDAGSTIDYQLITVAVHSRLYMAAFVSETVPCFMGPGGGDKELTIAIGQTLLIGTSTNDRMHAGSRLARKTFQDFYCMSPNMCVCVFWLCVRIIVHACRPAMYVHEKQASRQLLLLLLRPTMMMMRRKQGSRINREKHPLPRRPAIVDISLASLCFLCFRSDNRSDQVHQSVCPAHATRSSTPPRYPSLHPPSPRSRTRVLPRVLYR